MPENSLVMWLPDVFPFDRENGDIVVSTKPNRGLFVCVEVLRPSQPNGVVERGQFT